MEETVQASQNTLYHFNQYLRDILMHPKVQEVTQTITERSRASRSRYLARIATYKGSGRKRTQLSCGNLAHGFAACSPSEKDDLAADKKANIGIISSYNDMLSAHKPFEDFPEIIKKAITEAGGVAQFAGGVPAMCDGITQGEQGMDLSLFSRDSIAMSTAIGLSHDMFDGALMLGVCDKIVPGLLIGALSFGHLPMIFVPAGPMPSGLPNTEKVKMRQLFAQGKIGRAELLKAESESYHSEGTCTFYGTANSNQMLVEIMGLHLPGSSFVNPNTPLRDALTAEAARQVLKFTSTGEDYRPIGEVIDEKAIVNGLVGLIASGGSTNHTLHMIAIAKAAGIHITWDDFSELSNVVPLVTRIYPNGFADINHFHAAGGMTYLISTLLDNGLLHPDILTIANNRGMQDFRKEPQLDDNNRLQWISGVSDSLDTKVVRPANDPFSPNGGLQLLVGNLGRAVSKISAVKKEHHVVKAPAMVFSDQGSFKQAFEEGKLNKNFIAVVRFQGPRANGMPELHKLSPLLGVLQDQGYNVALVTDGRMSGASGKVPSAIHVTPECADGGPLCKVQNGDVIELDTSHGTLNLLVSDEELNKRIPAAQHVPENEYGMGRELFSIFRQSVSPAEQGASCVKSLGDTHD